MNEMPSSVKQELTLGKLRKILRKCKKYFRISYTEAYNKLIITIMKYQIQETIIDEKVNIRYRRLLMTIFDKNIQKITNLTLKEWKYSFSKIEHSY